MSSRGSAVCCAAGATVTLAELAARLCKPRQQKAVPANETPAVPTDSEPQRTTSSLRHNRLDSLSSISNASCASIPTDWGCPVRTRFLVDNSALKAETNGLSYHISKKDGDMDFSASGKVAWGSFVQGNDQGDGWVKVQVVQKEHGSHKAVVRFLPLHVNGARVLTVMPSLPRGLASMENVVVNERGPTGKFSARSRGSDMSFITLYAETHQTVEDTNSNASTVGSPRSPGGNGTSCSSGSGEDDFGLRSEQYTHANVSRHSLWSSWSSSGKNLIARQTTPSVSSTPKRLWAGGATMAKPKGLNEDAFFVDGLAIGVADGVGSMADFADKGMNSAAYAQELVQLTAQALRNRIPKEDGTKSSLTAAQALAEAEQQATSFGAATCTVLRLTEEDGLDAASLGDSGFMLLRFQKESERFEIVFRSKEQQHCWNFPYQFSKFPPCVKKELEEQGKYRPDSAADCLLYDFAVAPGDLLLVFTDGFSDNLFDHNVVSTLQNELASLSRCMSQSSRGHVPEAHFVDPSQLAKKLVDVAYYHSLQTLTRTPFADAARKKGYRFSGGKHDDITVVAAWVSTSS